MKKIITVENSGLAQMIQLIIMIVFCLILPDLLFGESNMKSTIVMLIILISYSILFHKIFLTKFNEAIALYKKEKFSESLIKFNEAYKFFIKHKIIDKYRFVIFLNSSKKSYREMSLLYIANTYDKIGKEKESIQTYKKILDLYPKCFEAKIALEDFNIKNNNDYNNSMNDIQIPLNKKKILLFILLVGLLISPSILIFTDNNVGLFAKYAIIISTLFFIIALIFLILKLFDNKPGLIIYRNGFIDNTSLISFGFIKWESVKSIYRTKLYKQKLIKIELFNTEEILKNQATYIQFLARLNKQRLKTGINLSSRLLNCNLSDLNNKLQNEYKRYKNA